jgi:anion transporter
MEDKRVDGFDPLDMGNYCVEKLPKIEKSGFEKWLAKLGIPLAILAFVIIYFFSSIPFLENFDSGNFTGDALKRFSELGAENFTRTNYAMLAIFVAAVILWITEAIPNYLTSLFLILAIVLTGVTSDKVAYAQLGHPVMWLNILSFVLASMLVKTQVAKRFALWFVIRFGKNSTWVIFSFIVINIVLSAFISATTAKATILLPIFMVIAAIYGARGGNRRNNFGRNLVLQNLFQINIGASGFLTGSGANLLAASLIAGSLGQSLFNYQDWFIAAFPLAMILIFIGWFVGTRIMFPLKPEEKVPQIEGGMEYLKKELALMGKMKFDEYKAIAIFAGVLAMWATDKQHGIDQTAVAFIGAVVALLPGIGIVKWNDVDIPWHLMIFSAGAYTLGAGLEVTGLPVTIVDATFNSLGLDATTPFWIIYMILTAMMLFSALLFQ